MSFSDLLNDTIDIHKLNGDVVPKIKASVQKNKVFVDDSKLLIEPGDLIVRKMSNGGEETFKVIDPGFHEGMGSIDAHYQMDVQKLGIPEANKAIQNITYNINGNNARVNQNSIDNSINISGQNEEIFKQINLIKQIIQDSNLASDEIQDANEILNEVETEMRSEKPRNKIIQALLNALPTIGDIASISSLIITLLK